MLVSLAKPRLWDCYDANNSSQASDFRLEPTLKNRALTFEMVVFAAVFCGYCFATERALASVDESRFARIGVY